MCVFIPVRQAAAGAFYFALEYLICWGYALPAIALKAID